MKLRIPYLRTADKTYFRKSGDDARQAEIIALGVCASQLLAGEMHHAKEMAHEAEIYREIARIWNDMPIRYSHAFSL